MITAKQIKKTTGYDSMFRAHKTGQLSENCVTFDEILPGVYMSLSLIKKRPIVNNSNFCVQNWFLSQNNQVSDKLHRLMLKCMIPTDQSIKQREMNPEAEIVRVFTIDPVDNDGDNLAYLIQVRYSPGYNLTHLRNFIKSNS